MALLHVQHSLHHAISAVLSLTVEGLQAKGWGVLGVRRICPAGRPEWKSPRPQGHGCDEVPRWAPDPRAHSSRPPHYLSRPASVSAPPQG